MSARLVSIIIPTYNRPELVQRAIQSALNQTYVNKETIVADDGTYNAVVVPDGVRYFQWSINRGKSAVMNDVVLLARGDYIVFLDDDNELMPRFLEVCMAELELEPADMITTGRFIRYKDHEVVAVPKLTPFTAVDWGWVMRKDKYIGYDPDLYGDEDADYGIRTHDQWRKVINMPLQIAYDTTSETSFTYPSPRRLAGLERFMAKHMELYKQYPDELRYLYRLAGRNYYKAGYRFKGIWYFWLSFLTRPNWRTLKHMFFILFGWRVYDWYMTHEEKK